MCLSIFHSEIFAFDAEPYILVGSALMQRRSEVFTHLTDVVTDKRNTGLQSIISAWRQSSCQWCDTPWRPLDITVMGISSLVHIGNVNVCNYIYIFLTRM